jgi:hypothetical protein
MGMFDSIRCDYPLPLPLEVVDKLPDIYEEEFQTKDFENLLNYYILTEDGELLFHKKTYEWRDDDSSFLKGYMEIVDEKIIPHTFHGLVNLYFYGTVYSDESRLSGYDISVEYIAKFNNGLLDSLDLLNYEVEDVTKRLITLDKLFKENKRIRNLWYNKYIFNTTPWNSFKKKILIYPINKTIKFLTKIERLILKYL